MNLKNEVLAFLFGMLLILLTFGDSRFQITIAGSAIGNLDAILGQSLWPVLDVFYPVATVAVFLLYGWSKQRKLRISPGTVLLFLSFLAALTLIIIDDLAQGVGVDINLPQFYWNIVMWFYPICSAIAFFLFGKANEIKNS